MTDQEQQELGKTLWNIANQLRGAMNADDFRDYMLSFLFLRYLSDNYEAAAQRELGRDYPELAEEDRRTPLAVWYEQNVDDVDAFEAQMRRKTHYVIQPEHLWASIAEMARVGNDDLLSTLKAGFKFIENESFSSTFDGLFSEINLDSEKLGKGYTERNTKLCSIIKEIAKGLVGFSTDNFGVNAIETTQSEPSLSSSIALIGLGVIFLILAARNGLKKPAAETNDQPSRFSKLVDGITPLKAFALAATVSVLNVKNLTIFLSAVSVLLLSELLLSTKLTMLVPLVVIFCTSVITPVAIYLIFPERSNDYLTRIKVAISRYSRPLGIGVTTILGVLLFYRGVSGII